MPERKSGSALSDSLLKRSRRRQERRADDLPPEETPTTVIPAVTDGPRTSVWLDFLRPSRSQAVIAVILFVTGLLVVMGVSAGRREADFSTMRRADLVSMLDTLNADARKLQAEIADLTTTKNRLESGVDSAKVANDEARKRLDTMEILAGAKPAAGPGIRITISDPKGKVGPELVLDAIEELRDAGAEVIQLNGSVRVAVDTWFGRDSSGRLVASGQVLTMPLTIEAIGDPATLEAGARFRGGLVSEVQNEAVGGSATIVTLDRVLIESVVTPKAPAYARPGG